MIKKDEARSIAEKFLDENIRPRISHEVVIVDCAVEDRADCWFFPYNGRGYLERDDFTEIMAGNLPILVNKETGAVGYER